MCMGGGEGTAVLDGVQDTWNMWEEGGGGQGEEGQRLQICSRENTSWCWPKSAGVAYHTHLFPLQGEGGCFQQQTTRLGAGVVQDARGGHVGLDGSDVDDVATALLHHVLGRQLGQGEHGQDVDVEGVDQAGPGDVDERILQVLLQGNKDAWGGGRGGVKSLQVC